MRWARLCVYTPGIPFFAAFNLQQRLKFIYTVRSSTISKAAHEKSDSLLFVLSFPPRRCLASGFVVSTL